MICQYCKTQAALTSGASIYPHRPDLFHLKFWQCSQCLAYVGCHKKGSHVNGRISDGTIPLGILANASLRAAKSSAHAALDPLWQNKKFRTRKRAYNWLANALKIPVNECHIGMFDEETCRKVVLLCASYR